MLVTRGPNADSQPASCVVPWIIGNHERPARAQSACATRPARCSPCCTTRARCPTCLWCAGPRSGPGRTACTRGGPGPGSSTRRATYSRPGRPSGSRRSPCTGSGRSSSASVFRIA